LSSQVNLIFDYCKIISVQRQIKDIMGLRIPPFVFTEHGILMLSNSIDAASTAYRVGYERPSQFSREYARRFGNPPGRDINLLRQQESSVQSGRISGTPLDSPALFRFRACPVI